MDQLTTYLPVSALLKECNVVATPPWDHAHDITPEDIERAVAERTFEPHPVGAQGARQDHINRIAYLVVQGWDDPISVDVGVPWAPGYRPTWYVADGNHRLYAAYIRKDTTLRVEVGGCLKTFEDLFGVTL